LLLHRTNISNKNHGNGVAELRSSPRLGFSIAAVVTPNWKLAKPDVLLVSLPSAVARVFGLCLRIPFGAPWLGVSSNMGIATKSIAIEGAFVDMVKASRGAGEKCCVKSHFVKRSDSIPNLDLGFTVAE
jgi:hypothetical protein